MYCGYVGPLLGQFRRSIAKYRMTILREFGVGHVRRSDAYGETCSRTDVHVSTLETLIHGIWQCLIPRDADGYGLFLGGEKGFAEEFAEHG